MNDIALFFSISYFLMTFYFLINWLRFSLRHPSVTPGDRFLSFVILIITTVLWPLIVPMSCMEIIQSRKLELGTLVPVLFAAVVISISFYFS